MTGPTEKTFSLYEKDLEINGFDKLETLRQMGVFLAPALDLPFLSDRLGDHEACLWVASPEGIARWLSDVTPSGDGTVLDSVRRRVSTSERLWQLRLHRSRVLKTRPGIRAIFPLGQFVDQDETGDGGTTVIGLLQIVRDPVSHWVNLYLSFRPETSAAMRGAYAVFVDQLVVQVVVPVVYAYHGGEDASKGISPVLYRDSHTATLPAYFLQPRWHTGNATMSVDARLSCVYQLLLDVSKETLHDNAAYFFAKIDNIVRVILAMIDYVMLIQREQKGQGRSASIPYNDIESAVVVGEIVRAHLEATCRTVVDSDSKEGVFPILIWLADAELVSDRPEMQRLRQLQYMMAYEQLKERPLTARILIPIQGSDHWSLLSISGPAETPVFYHYDSMAGATASMTPHSHLASAILGEFFDCNKLQVLTRRPPLILHPLNSANRQRQTECGLYTLGTAWLLLDAKDPRAVKFDNIRQFVVDHYTTNMTAFWRSAESFEVVLVKLYCLLVVAIRDIIHTRQA